MYQIAYASPTKQGDISAKALALRNVLNADRGAVCDERRGGGQFVAEVGSGCAKYITY